MGKGEAGGVLSLKFEGEGRAEVGGSSKGGPAKAACLGKYQRTLPEPYFLLTCCLAAFFATALLPQ